MTFTKSAPQYGGQSGLKMEQPISLTVAGDFGYSTAQLFGSMVDVTQPSYFLPLDLDYLPDAPEQGVFSYLEGDSVELFGKTFAVGHVAHAIDASACRKNADAVENKIENSLIMLLGLLTYQAGLSGRVTLNLLTCLQKVTPELRGAVVARLRGHHKIKYGTQVLEVDVAPLGCADEGLGAIAVSGVDARQDIVVVSLGGGTTNVSQFQGGKLLTQKPFDGGVMKLYEQLALAPTITEHLKGKGDIHIIRQGVERQDLFYGKSVSPDRFSFETDYQQSLTTWAATTLKRPLQYAKPLLMNADLGLVFGGGAMLPGIEKFLKAHGYRIALNPVACNVRGLYEIAKAAVAKRG